MSGDGTGDECSLLIQRTMKKEIIYCSIIGCEREKGQSREPSVGDSNVGLSTNLGAGSLAEYSLDCPFWSPIGRQRRRELRQGKSLVLFWHGGPRLKVGLELLEGQDIREDFFFLHFL